MKVTDVINKSRREFSIAISLAGVIPFLVFAYILAARVSSVRDFKGEIGLIMVITVAVFILGISVGKKMFSSLVSEIIEKDRKAAITEIALAVGHEIDNPLLAIRGNLQILESYIAEIHAPDTVKNRLKTIMDNFERVRQVKDQFLKLSNPKTTRIFGGINIVDINR